MKHLLTTFLLLLTAFTPAYAGLKEAMAAMDREDYPTAYKEFSALAVKGDTQAMISVGLLYHQGQGFKQDYGQAMEWYLKAFKKRTGDAYNNIGVLYRDGLGVEKNLEVSYALFWIGYWRGLGTDETQMRIGRNVDKISKVITQEQIEEALKMTEEYVTVFVEKRGKLGEKERALKFSAKHHPIKGLGDIAKSDPAASPAKYHEFTCEIKVPKGLVVDDNAKFDLVTEEGMTGNMLARLDRREENGVVILKESTLIHAEKRRAIVIRTRREPAQVFKLTIPSEPKPADWTKWRRPDYVETGDATWTFMHDLKTTERSTKIPTNYFELRYKIEKHQE